MNTPTVLQGALLIVLALCFATSVTIAQDMAKVAPNNVKVLLDNDKVRVLDIQIKTGDKIPMHSHPANIVYSQDGAKFTTTMPDGKVVDTVLKPGEAIYRDAVTHANEAVADGHVVMVEIKEHKAMKKK